MIQFLKGHNSKQISQVVFFNFFILLSGILTNWFRGSVRVKTCTIQDNFFHLNLMQFQ